MVLCWLGQVSEVLQVLHCKNKVVCLNPHKATSVAAPVPENVQLYVCSAIRSFYPGSQAK